MLKKCLLAAAVCLSIGGVQAAQAQPSNNVNCAALSGTPMICLKNMSSYAIIGVQATSGMSYGSSWVPIPGGPIPPGGTSIVNFGKWNGGCNMYVTVRTQTNTHTFPNADVCRITSFNITGW